MPCRVKLHQRPSRLLPVQRRFPLLRAHRIPAEREPQLRAPIAPVFDEREVFPVGHRVRRELEIIDEHAVARPLVIECKARPAVADIERTAVDGDPAHSARAHRRQRPALRVGGRERIARKQMLDIGQHQLLMLLFVIDSECHDLAQRPPAHRLAVQQIAQARIDMARYAITSSSAGRVSIPRSGRGCLSPTAL